MRTHEISGPEETQITGQLRIPQETAIRHHIAQFWLWGEVRDSKKKRKRNKVPNGPLQQVDTPAVPIKGQDSKQPAEPKPPTIGPYQGTWSGWDS